jgi:hypothetical protein
LSVDIRSRVDQQLETVGNRIKSRAEQSRFTLKQEKEVMDRKTAPESETTEANHATFAFKRSTGSDQLTNSVGVAVGSGPYQGGPALTRKEVSQEGRENEKKRKERLRFCRPNQG